jgi:hypothetical protein
MNVAAPVLSHRGHLLLPTHWYVACERFSEKIMLKQKASRRHSAAAAAIT